jgi:hypothetical protein
MRRNDVGGEGDEGLVQFVAFSHALPAKLSNTVFREAPPPLAL